MRRVRRGGKRYISAMDIKILHGPKWFRVYTFGIVVLHDNKVMQGFLSSTVFYLFAYNHFLTL